MLLCVTPVYGNGWTDGSATVDEPSPFKVEIDENENGDFTGQIVSNEHALAGYHFKASRRHTEADSLYNCRVSSNKGLVLQGYCKLDKDSEN